MISSPLVNQVAMLRPSSIHSIKTAWRQLQEMGVDLWWLCLVTEVHEAGKSNRKHLIFW